MATPILYSFRRCPYAIRARMVLHYSAIDYELREVDLKFKPAAMLAASPKGTVPVLVVDEMVIDESLAIMQWGLAQTDEEDWLSTPLDHPLLLRNDDYFKHYLDRYKYCDRYPEGSKDDYFHQAAVFLNELEGVLAASTSGHYFLESARISSVDVAIFPFVRQFAFADKARFDQMNLPKLQQWLQWFLAAPLFLNVMHKQACWVES